MQETPQSIYRSATALSGTLGPLAFLALPVYRSNRLGFVSILIIFPVNLTVNHFAPLIYSNANCCRVGASLHIAFVHMITPRTVTKRAQGV